MTLDDVVQSAQDWAADNLDENALNVLQNVDQAKVREFLKSVQKDFEGEYVVDLSGLKQTAQAILPILESHPETRPYAKWLTARLDYLEVADQFRLIVPPVEPKASKLSPLLPNPQPEKEREIWIKALSNRPWPARAKPYISKLKPIFASQNVPSQLVWIAEVESSFDPQAMSPAGAAGLFQLMPDTARQYGLELWPADQRLNSEDSARAAAKYLAYLYRRFKDWRLALAAYNAGEGTVQKLLDRCQATGFDAIATHLPAETQMYVPKVEATLKRREGVQLSELPPVGDLEFSASTQEPGSPDQ